MATLFIDGKRHKTYGQVSKAELYAALAAIERLVSGDEAEDWEMRYYSDQLDQSDLTPRERAMVERISAVYRLSHGWQPAHSCFGSHKTWRAGAAPTVSSGRRESR